MDLLSRGASRRFAAAFPRAACQPEGFDAGLTEAVIARHLADPARLEMAERAWDGVAKYARRLVRGTDGP